MDKGNLNLVGPRSWTGRDERDTGVKGPVTPEGPEQLTREEQFI